MSCPELARSLWHVIDHPSYSLNSLKGIIYGIIEGTTIGVIKGDTRSLDYGPN